MLKHSRCREGLSSGSSGVWTCFGCSSSGSSSPAALLKALKEYETARSASSNSSQLVCTNLSSKERLPENVFIIDSGAGVHITPYLHLLSDQQTCSRQIATGNGMIAATIKGSITLSNISDTNNGSLTLREVYY
eukprot:GHRQ01028181.1.p1 GENE.GHRQ01028181.1~~GHRQ01028181.1.p1  ORF type:complete len:134 (+),score=38.89 GHRQ01028181.1:390-791(+)